tara:strand:- start:90 stop:422 length:333 start_codon:yes stop_codon:yes gene_type:complete
MKKVKIGTAGVDSGQLMVTDPCYINKFINNDFDDYEGKKKDTSYSYSGACTQTLRNENQGGELANGLGVVFSTGIGDGSYPVYAYLGEIDGFGERVLKVEIDFTDHVLLD